MGKLSENQEAEVPGDGDTTELKFEPSTEKEEYSALCQLVNPISQPLASRKLAKKLYKLVKKSAKEKGSLRHGLSDVMKAIRKNEKGVIILAGY
jgi:H/ACA ribonucleoprotein complex subunit 2